MAFPAQPTMEIIRENARREHNEQQESSRYRVYSERRSQLCSVEKEFKSATVEEFRELISEAKKSSKNPTILRRLKDALSESELNRVTLIRTEGAVHGLVGILCSNDVACQIVAASCLMNLLATSDHKVAKPVVRQATPYFIEYLKGGSSELKDICCLALANIAADCAACCGILKSQNFLDAIKSVLHSSSPDAQASILFALGCYMKNKSEDILDILERDVIALSNLHLCLNTQVPDCVAEASRILFYISTRSECCRHLLNVEIVEPVFDRLKTIVCTASNEESSKVFLNPTECKTVTYLLRTVAALFVTSDVMFLPTPKTSFEELRQTLTLMLSTNYEHLTKETLWLINNMTCFLNSGSTWFNDEILLSCIASKMFGPADQLEMAIECFCNILTLGSDVMAHLCHGIVSEVTLVRLLSSVDIKVISKTLTMAHLLLRNVSIDSLGSSFGEAVANLRDSGHEDVSRLASALLLVHRYGEP